MDDEKIPDDVLWHQSGINPAGEPFVQLLRGNQIVGQMTVAEARDHAQAVIEAAEAAETDAFIFDWVVKHMGARKQQAAGLLVSFRKYRALRTGKRGGPTSPRDWVMPPEKPEE